MRRRTIMKGGVPLVCYAALWGLFSFALAGMPQRSPVPATSLVQAYDSLTDVIRVSTNLVMVPVSVTDAEGHAVKDLEIRDFIIEEDGRPETVVEMAEPGQTALQLALLFDISGSLKSHFEFEQQAAVHFLEKIWNPGDAVSVITFSAKPHVYLLRTTSLPQAIQGLSKIESTEDSTAFFDSVVLAANLLNKSATPATLKAEIVLSDGEDNSSSRHGLSDALMQVQRSDCIFYSINPCGTCIRLNKISIEGQEALASLASQTGGTAFISDKISDLDEIFERIATELQAQYLLGYYSSNTHTNGTFRRIAVRIPKSPSLRVRARQGYYAAMKS